MELLGVLYNNLNRNEKGEKMYKLPEEVLKGILAYLYQRPYAEVAQGIAALSKLEKIEERKNDD